MDTARLTRVLKPVGHNALRTLSEGRAYILALPPWIRRRPVWKVGLRLLASAEKSRTEKAIRDATDQLELALFSIYRLEDDRTPRTR